MKLVIAEGDLLEEIVDATFPVWNEGLTRQAYGQWNASQLRTDWGARNLHRFALLDQRGRWVSTAKRYRLPIRLNGVDGLMFGLGAVFTRPNERGKGYAGAIIDLLIEQAGKEGAAVAGLFSEIGEGLYRRLGFRTVPLDEVTIEVERRDGAPAMLVRSGDVRDLAAVASMHEARAGTTRFALRRDVQLIHYALSKKRTLAGLGPSGLRQTEFFIAEEGGSPVAYVILTVSPGGWTMEEAGDRDPAGARLGALFQVLLAREPAHHTPLMRAWWPPAFPVPPQIRLTDRISARDIFMMRPVREVGLPGAAADVFYWRGDYF